MSSTHLPLLTEAPSLIFSDFSWFFNPYSCPFVSSLQTCFSSSDIGPLLSPSSVPRFLQSLLAQPSFKLKKDAG